MIKYKEKLNELETSRTSILTFIFNTETALKTISEQIEEQTFKIKVQLENDISGADQGEAKTKYSNAEKRRLELEKRLKDDEQLYNLNKELNKEQINLIRYQHEDKILRIRERYTFKLIDLYLAEINYTNELPEKFDAQNNTDNPHNNANI